jgi:hypothetical protein
VLSEKGSGRGPFTTAQVGSATGDDPPLHIHSLECFVNCIVRFDMSFQVYPTTAHAEGNTINL